MNLWTRLKLAQGQLQIINKLLMEWYLPITIMPNWDAYLFNQQPNA